MTAAPWSGEVHPFADLFPMLPDDELHLLAEDIRANGLQQPLVIDATGRLVAGRNRLRACEIADVEPTFDTLDTGDDDVIAAFVISENVHRRHQSTGSRAMSTALVLAESGQRRDGKWAYGATSNGQDSGSSRSAWRELMRQAGVVLDHAPDLATAVVSGDLALDAAFRQAEQRRDAEVDRIRREEQREQQESEAREFVEREAPDLAARVDGTDLLTYSEALAIWQQRNREEAERIRREKAARDAEEKAARENAEQEVLSVANALLTLAALEYPEARARIRAAFAQHAEAAPPSARAMHSPDRVRALAAWMTIHADEMEACHGQQR